ncbi:solute carrier family 22 member 13-like isoform X2 [Ornithodoros turicata]|uniref:solute carrier family 22 member 13-like isoform X2 n=1 Tax=Ornithodoros turicata TaxID=34597 RepID=UPI003138EC5E
MIFQMDLPNMDGLGAYQQVLVLLCVIGTVPQTWMMGLLEDSLVDIEHWCTRPDSFSLLNGNVTNTALQQYNSTAHDPCLGYPVYQNASPVENVSNLMACEYWDYIDDQTRTSLVQQFDLVCHNKWLRDVLKYANEACCVLGLLVFGHIADTRGRRPVLFSSCLLFFSFCTLASLAPSFTLYAITTSIAALGTGGFRVAAIVLLLEWVAPEWRCSFALTYPLGIAVGVFTWTALQFLTQSWMYLQLAIGLCMCIVFPFYVVIQESYGWLVARDRRKRALKSLMIVLKINRVVGERGFFQDDESATEENKTGSRYRKTCQICRSTTLFRKLVVCLPISAVLASSEVFTMNFLWNTVGVPDFWKLPLLHCVQLASIIPSIIALRLCSRRWTMVALLFVAGVVHLAVPLLPHRPVELETLLEGATLVVVRCASTVAIVVVVESMVTAVRCSALGLWLALWNASFACCQHLLHLAPTNMASLVVGSACIVAALLSIFLQETKGCRLPDTTEEKLKQVNRSSEDIPLSEKDDEHSPYMNIDE